MEYCEKKSKNGIEHGHFRSICPSCDQEKGIIVPPERWIKNIKQNHEIYS